MIFGQNNIIKTMYHSIIVSSRIYHCSFNFSNLMALLNKKLKDSIFIR